MNKKIILSVSVAVLLASTSLFAYGSQCGEKQDGKQHKMMMKQGGKQHKMMMKQGKHQNAKGGKLMQMMKMLDLSDDQRTKIRSIVQVHMKNKVNPYDAFTDNTFDKAKFIKLANDKKNGKIERKAELISRIYAVLNSTQKKDLKTMLDMHGMKKGKMMKKSCNGKNCKSNR